MTQYEHIIWGMGLFNIVYFAILQHYLVIPGEKEYWKNRMGIKKKDDLFKD